MPKSYDEFSYGKKGGGYRHLAYTRACAYGASDRLPAQRLAFIPPFSSAHRRMRPAVSVSFLLRSCKAAFGGRHLSEPRICAVDSANFAVQPAQRTFSSRSYVRKEKRKGGF